MNYLKVKAIRLQESPTLSCRSDQDAIGLWNSTIAGHEIYDPQKEHLVVFSLNTKLRVLDWHIVSIGCHNQAICNPLEVFRPLIVAGASNFILMHNHPSGDTTPSQSDIKITNSIKQAAEILHIKMQDHVIIDSLEHTKIHSFRSDGRI